MIVKERIGNNKAREKKQWMNKISFLLETFLESQNARRFKTAERRAQSMYKGWTNRRRKYTLFQVIINIKIRYCKIGYFSISIS